MKQWSDIPLDGIVRIRLTHCFSPDGHTESARFHQANIVLSVLVLPGSGLVIIFRNMLVRE